MELYNLQEGYIIEKLIDLLVLKIIKIIASVYQTGGDYFLCDLLPSVYPSSKQVKSKPNTNRLPNRAAPN